MASTPSENALITGRFRDESQAQFTEDLQKRTKVRSSFSRFDSCYDREREIDNLVQQVRAKQGRESIFFDDKGIVYGKEKNTVGIQDAEMAGKDVYTKDAGGGT